MLPLLIKGGWLSKTTTPRRSRGSSRKHLDNPRDQDVDKDGEQEQDEETEGSLESFSEIPPVPEARPPAREPDKPPAHTDDDRPELIDGGNGYLIPKPREETLTPIGDLTTAALFAAGQIQYPDDH